MLGSLTLIRLPLTSIKISIVLFPENIAVLVSPNFTIEWENSI